MKLAARRSIVIFLVCAFGCGSPQPEAPTQAQSAEVTVTIAPIVSQQPPIAIASVTAVASAPPDTKCRAGRITFEEALERCRTSDRAKVVPDAIVAEIGGPTEVKPDQEAAYELQLVNRSDRDMPLTLRITCAPSLYAVDAKKQEVIRHESTSMAETVSSCNAPGTVIGVVLQPGGMLVTPMQWRARGEHYRDGKLLKRQPLGAGKYTLRSSTWLVRGGPDEEEKTHGASVSVVGELGVTVR